MNKTLFQIEAKQLVIISLPLIAANIVQAMSGFMSTWMLARLGTDSLAASGLVASLYFALVVVFWGVLSGISVLISQAHGANEPQRITLLMQQGILCAALVSIPMILIIWGAPWLLDYMKVEPAIIQLAVDYLHAMAWSIIPGLCLVLTEQLLLGIQKSTAVMLLSLLSVPLEIGISYLLIFGKWGAPYCGIAGIGYGLAIAYTIVSLLAIIYIHYHREIKAYRIFSELPRLELSYLREIFRMGWPIGAMYGIEVSLFAAIALLMGRVGAVALDAHQILMQFLGVQIMITFAIMQATAIRVGHALGRKAYDALGKIGHIGMLFSSFIALIVGLIYCLFPDWIIGLDLNPTISGNEAIFALAAKLLIVGAIFQLAEAVRIVAMGALRGMNDTRFAMFNSLICFWLIGFSLSYFLGVILNGQAVGLWLGLTIGIIVGAIILTIRYQRLAVRYISNSA